MYKLALNHNLSKSDFNEAQLTSQLIDEIENIQFTSYLRMPMIKKSLINTFSNHGFVNKIRLHPEHKTVSLTSQETKPAELNVIPVGSVKAPLPLKNSANVPQR